MHYRFHSNGSLTGTCTASAAFNIRTDFYVTWTEGVSSASVNCCCYGNQLRSNRRVFEKRLEQLFKYSLNIIMNYTGCFTHQSKQSWEKKIQLLQNTGRAGRPSFPALGKLCSSFLPYCCCFLKSLPYPLKEMLH